VFFNVSEEDAALEIKSSAVVTPRSDQEENMLMDQSSDEEKRKKYARIVQGKVDRKVIKQTVMMTSLKMKEKGLYITAVHDSYWTHPCDVEIMNEVSHQSISLCFSVCLSLCLDIHLLYRS